MDALTTAIDFNRGLAALAADEEVRPCGPCSFLGLCSQSVFGMFQGQPGSSHVGRQLRLTCAAC